MLAAGTDVDDYAMLLLFAFILHFAFLICRRWHCYVVMWVISMQVLLNCHLRSLIMYL